MAVVDADKMAASHYCMPECFCVHTHTQVRLETERVHQIRVCMSHIGYPLAGDPIYGGHFRIPLVASQAPVQILRGFPRQILHARFLELDHLATGTCMKWESSLPGDLPRLFNLLRQDREAFVG